MLNLDTVYRFLDKLNNKLKDQVEQISFQHTKKILNNDLSIVFYDMTTLCFEASDEDDLRKTGFSKDGRPANLVNPDRFPKFYRVTQIWKQEKKQWIDTFNYKINFKGFILGINLF